MLISASFDSAPSSRPVDVSLGPLDRSPVVGHVGPSQAGRLLSALRVHRLGERPPLLGWRLLEAIAKVPRVPTLLCGRISFFSTRLLPSPVRDFHVEVTSTLGIASVFRDNIG